MVFDIFGYKGRFLKLAIMPFKGATLQKEYTAKRLINPANC
jgi:hypothetical protein